jgi:hypothetical protein
MTGCLIKVLPTPNRPQAMTVLLQAMQYNLSGVRLA